MIGRVFPVLLLATALAVGGGCRQLLEPRPEPALSPNTYRLILDVIPPEGVELGSIQLGHDNRIWVGPADSLRRDESRDVPDSGRLVFDGLVGGPTLLEYRWYGPDGEFHSGTWGVVEIPSPPLELDFSQTNLTILARPSEQGQPLPVYRTAIELRNRLGNGPGFSSLYNSHSAYAESLSVHALPGAWRVTGRWDFDSDSALNSIATEWADSVRVPGRHDLGVDFGRIWMQLLLGGVPLRNAQVFITLNLPQEDERPGTTITYRPRALAGESIPLLYDTSSFRLDVSTSSLPFGSSAPFPQRLLWMQAEAGDTLRVDLAEHRVRFRLFESGERATFLTVGLEAQRADTGELSLTTDEEGEVTGWLPTGNYLAELDSPRIDLSPGDRQFHVSADTLIAWEVIPR